jgi:cytochrome c-type biogenesis protein CcmH/NrfF
MDLIAAHFLAGALLTWAMPIGLLVLVGLWWTVLMKRRSGGES